MCFEKPWQTVTVVGLLTTVAIFSTVGRLSLNADLTELLPKSFESVQDLEVLEKRFGGTGYAVVVGAYGESSADYWHYSARGIETFDVMAGVVKSIFFGGALALVSCYKGFHSRPGAAGVGRATTEAFVASFIIILIINLLMAIFFQGLYAAVWGTSPSVAW